MALRNPARDYASRVVEVLKIEAAALRLSSERLDRKQLEHAIQLLLTCSGKVVVAGIGKSGLVARKVASTLTSTGSPAVYLHPSDALHGDLGLVASTDVVIVLSNSGETAELMAMLPQ